MNETMVVINKRQLHAHTCTYEHILRRIFYVSLLNWFKMDASYFFKLWLVSSFKRSILIILYL